VGGFSLLIRGILAQAQIFILDTIQKNYHEQFEEFGVTHASLVSTQFVRYLDQVKNGFHIKHILLGGSAIPITALIQALKLKLPIYKSYGMTEMGSQVCTSGQLTKSEQLHFSGQLLDFRELKIEDQKIFVRGPCLFKGYLKENKLEIAVDADGWFFTKDLGMEYDGKIQIFGRADRIFQSAGENISPETIEQELLKIPGVSKAYVCPEKDLEYGLRAIAYIEKEIDLQDEVIMKQLEKKLSGLFRPKALRPWSESPKVSWKQ
jgi:O-succinylbenzoic acid--CoA ligase